MATTITTPTKPTVGGSDGTWGTTLNAAIDTLKTNDDNLKTTADAAMPKSGGTFTDDVTAKTTAQVRSDLGNVSGSVAFDLSDGNCFTLTLTGTATFAAPTNEISGTVANWMLWKLTNGGAHTITWNSAYRFPGGTEPDWTTSGVDVLGWVTFDGGTTWYLAGHAFNMAALS